MIRSIFNGTREKAEPSVLFGGAPLLVAMVAVHLIVDKPMVHMTTKQLKFCLNPDPEFTAEVLKFFGISLCYIALCIAITTYFIHIIYKTGCDKKSRIVWLFVFNFVIWTLIWGILYSEFVTCAPG